jgi:hypothetical protein
VGIVYLKPASVPLQSYRLPNYKISAASAPRRVSEPYAYNLNLTPIMGRAPRQAQLLHRRRFLGQVLTGRWV